MNVDIAALRAGAKEKGIERGSLIDPLESALLTASPPTHGPAPAAATATPSPPLPTTATPAESCMTARGRWTRLRP